MGKSYSKVIKVLLILTVLFVTFYLVTNYMFNSTVYDAKLTSTPQVWAHAAYLDKSRSNPLNLIGKAFQNGASGVELDVFYDEKTQDFVLTHDNPYFRYEGKLFFLHQVFERFKQRGYYWIDFKNLSFSNYSKARDRMLKLLNKYQLFHLVYVESTNGLLLRTYSSHGIRTIFWIAYDRNWTRPFKFLYLKAIIGFSRFNGISSPYQRIGDPYFMKTFGHLPIFLFTLNRKSLFDHYVQRKNIHVILTKRFYKKR